MGFNFFEKQKAILNITVKIALLEGRHWVILLKFLLL